MSKRFEREPFEITVMCVGCGEHLRIRVEAPCSATLMIEFWHKDLERKCNRCRDSKTKNRKPDGG